MTPGVLADRLVADAVAHVEDFVERFVPDWRVPKMFAGHVVGPDVTADLAFTLGMLHEAGVGSVAGTTVPEAISRILRPIDGRGTHTFYSYRVAETLARFGPLADNPLLEGWSAAEVEKIALACDTTDWVELLDAGVLPRNYAAVLSRCETSRRALGIDVDEDLLERLVGQVRDTMAASATGHIDDSQSRIGRYDIYTCDLHLFTLPFADRLGDVWERGAIAALDLAERVAATDGSAITWGCSTGALSVCLTIEMGALALARAWGHPGEWLARAANARSRFGSWMADGLITAHQYRSTYDYRGPERRLQMTLDCLGKLVDSALMLRQATDPEVIAAPLADAFGDRDELIVFDSDTNAAVWTHRSSELSFVVPFVGPTISDYLPAPHSPGTFECPVDSPLAVGVPHMWAGFGYHLGGGLPTSLEKTEHGVVAEYRGFPTDNQMEAAESPLPLGGTRRVEYRVDGRTLHVTEQLHFERASGSLAIQVAECAHRGLNVAFTADERHTVTAIDTAGLKEQRSFWSELPRVHQIDVDPSTDVTIGWSVSPRLRLSASERDHPYMASIYRPLADRIDVTQFPTGDIARGDVTAHLRHVDQFHLHWPEWLTMQDPEVHRRFIDDLRVNDVAVLWTQHNLEPHLKSDLDAVYRLWAGAADAVIHHSEWGMAAARHRYPFRADARHHVIAHPHWGHLMDDPHDLDRALAEAALGLRPCAIRLAVLGAPRQEKDVQLAIDAVHRSSRADIGLVVPIDGEHVPDDDRITAIPAAHRSRAEYNRLLGAADVVVLPYDASGMLTTGVVGDVIGAGRAAIVSPWPYLAEAVGDAGILYDGSLDGLVAVIDSLDADTVSASAAAARALRASCSREVVAEAHLAVMYELGVGLTRR